MPKVAPMLKCQRRSAPWWRTTSASLAGGALTARLPGEGGARPRHHAEGTPDENVKTFPDEKG